MSDLESGKRTPTLRNRTIAGETDFYGIPISHRSGKRRDFLPGSQPVLFVVLLANGSERKASQELVGVCGVAHLVRWNFMIVNPNFVRILYV